jgi:hypothetical protein
MDTWILRTLSEVSMHHALQKQMQDRQGPRSGPNPLHIWASDNVLGE